MYWKPYLHKCHPNPFVAVKSSMQLIKSISRDESTMKIAVSDSYSHYSMAINNNNFNKSQQSTYLNRVVVIVISQLYVCIYIYINYVRLTHGIII